MRQKFQTTIAKIYISNFLTGLVFWYGIEKLFMQHIGITPAQIGLVLAVMYVVTLVADIPAGMLADKWSRKGVLVLSTMCLALASLICGTSHNAWQYAVGYALYGVYLVCTSGTYQALVYDVLHEQSRAKEYSKIMGRAYALFLVGAATGNLIGGFLAQWSHSLVLPFIVSIVTCVLNAFITATIKEPTFHKKEQKERMLKQLKQSAAIIFGLAVLRALTVIWCMQAIMEPFDNEFSQLYFLHFTREPIVLGILWASAALAWAFGSFVAHYFKKHLAWAICALLTLIIGLGLTSQTWGMTLFFAEVFAGGVVSNLIETRIQDHTPSAVRSATASIFSSISRIIGLPIGILFGWLMSQFSVFAILHVLAISAALTLLYWLVIGLRRIRTEQINMRSSETEIIPEFNKP